MAVVSGRLKRPPVLAGWRRWKREQKVSCQGAAVAAGETHWTLLRVPRRPARRAPQRRVRRRAQRSRKRRWSWGRGRRGRSWSRWGRNRLGGPARPAAGRGDRCRRAASRRRGAGRSRARRDHQGRSAERNRIMLNTKSWGIQKVSFRTCSIAGSLGSPPCSVGWGFGGSTNRMSLMSEPRKMMYS